MAYKQLALDERTPITIYKRKASRSLKLSVASDGSVRVSIPTWAPYRAGLEFARSRQAWIETQRRPAQLLSDHVQIGKTHRLRLVADSTKTKPLSRLRAGEIIIYYPSNLAADDPTLQAAASSACIRALRQEAEELLPQRLQTLADQYGFQYRSVIIKKLKGRWGSCDHQANVTLNLYLMQLPWQLVDYVLLHELTHTQVLRHGPQFWQAMRAVLPDVNQHRKALRNYQPTLVPTE